jgi:hypothetical protein
VYAVAIAALKTTIEQEVPALAADLGITAYEARLKLSTGMPAIVLTSQDKALAMQCLTSLRARGHDAIACDANAIVPNSAMTSLKRFRLDPDGIVASEDAKLPYASILALVRATHRLQSETRSQVEEKKFRPGAALLTGGVVMTKTITREIVEQKDERMQVLYIFRNDGEPWILREAGTDYASLAEKRAPTQLENFRTTIQLLRAHAPQAVYDERLVSARKASGQIVAVGAGGTGFTASTEPGTDLLAHLIALGIARLQR